MKAISSSFSLFDLIYEFLLKIAFEDQVITKLDNYN